jgi:peroxidase
LKYGDRHYYENGHDKKIRYSLAELNEIRKASVGRLLCDNIDIDFVPKNPWLVDSYENPLVNCDSLPRVNLRVFKYK